MSLWLWRSFCPLLWWTLSMTWIGNANWWRWIINTPCITFLFQLSHLQTLKKLSTIKCYTVYTFVREFQIDFSQYISSHTWKNIIFGCFQFPPINSKCQTQCGHLQHHPPNIYLTHFFAAHVCMNSPFNKVCMNSPFNIIQNMSKTSHMHEISIQQSIPIPNTRCSS